MPQDQFRQVNGPSGPINFPSEMSDGEVTSAMQKLYPPKAAVPEHFMSENHPGYWDQIKQGVPVLKGDWLPSLEHGFHSRSMPLEDTTQLIYPERTYSQTSREAHPIRTGFDEFAGGLTSPDNLLLMKGMGALGLATGKIGQLLPRLASGVFAGQMGYSSTQNVKDSYHNWQRYKDTGDEQYLHEAQRLGTHALLNGAMALLSTHHATKGERAGSAEAPPEQTSSPKTGLAPISQEAKINVEAVKPTPAAPPPIKDPASVGIIGEQTAKPRTPGEPLQHGFNPNPPEDLGTKVRTDLTSPSKPAIMVEKGEEKPVFTSRDLQDSLQKKTVPKLGTSPKLAPKPLESLGTEQPMQMPKSALNRVFYRGQELKSQGLSEPEQVFRLMKEFPAYADQIAEAYKSAPSQKTGSPAVGGEASPAATSKPTEQSVSAAAAAEGSGESVSQPQRPTINPFATLEIDRKAQAQSKAEGYEGQAHVQRSQEIKDQMLRGEPRSLRGDLGERQARLPDLDVFNQRVKDMLKKTPGMAEGTAKRVVAEQLRKEMGSLNLGGPEEDPTVRRERKIGQWIDRMRDPKASPEELNRVLANLKSYGVTRDDIIRRVSGAKGFAKTEAEQSLEERVGDPKEFSSPVERAADLEAKLTGDSEMAGVKSPDIEELERIHKLLDERGGLSFRRIKGKAPPGQGQPVQQSSLKDLTDKIESAMKAIPPDDSRMKAAERIANAWNTSKDELTGSIGRIAAQAVALKDWYLREPKMTDYRSAVGRFSGALNRSAWELRDYTNKIKKQLPDPARREAITNWLQAGGDDQILADRAARSKGKLRVGYEAARNLTTEEKFHAKLLADHFDTRLKEAVKLDILKDGLDNYVPQVWKPKDQTLMGNFFSSLHRGGLLKTDFNSAKKRVFDSYFEGEQAGRIPVNKDIGFLVASWEKAINQAIASRAFVRDLSSGLASDGRPIVAPSGVGKAVHEITGEPAEAYFIHPKIGPDETGDYKALNHSALTKHVWVAKDDFGAPIFLKGDLRVHPEHAEVLDNVINRGKWAAAHPTITTILKGQAFFKQTLLAGFPLNPFHQIQEGTHAIFHKVNPFNPPALDLNHPSMSKLLDHGLVIASYDPMSSFEEGVSAGGAVSKIPGMGRFNQKYTEYVFQDYIPRLKGAMGIDAYERNIKRFSKDIASGKITTDQVAELTANQANAAFGELNYMMIGRSPETQAWMRMAFLAPDFLEARARFVGQALRPYGREQYAALVRGAAGMYLIARVLNKLFDDNPHWDKPFSLVVKGYEYKMRSLPGDIWHLMSDSHSFLLHRFNPMTVRPLMELATGRDDMGRKRLLGEQAMDFVRSLTPMQLQGLSKSGDRDLTGSVISSFGVSRTVHRSKAAALAHEFAVSSIPTDITSHHIYELVRDIEKGDVDSTKINDWLQDGQMNPADLKKVRELARMPELYRDWHRLPEEQKAKVLIQASPQERALLRHYGHKNLDTSKLLPEQRQEFIEQYSRPPM